MKIDDDVEPALPQFPPDPQVFDDASKTERQGNDDDFVELWVAGNDGRRLRFNEVTEGGLRKAAAECSDGRPRRGSASRGTSR